MRPLLALVIAAVLAGLTACDDPPAPVTPVTRVTPVTQIRPATTVNVVAHEDDDLLFINPDVSRDITAGRRVVTVFMTAGDAGERDAYWQGREAGARAAYARMAGTRNRWRTARVSIGGEAVVRARLAGRPIELIFLRLPDGRGYAKHGFATMRRLWTGRIATIRSVDRATEWTRESLTGALEWVFDTYEPDLIRTLEFGADHGGGDHNDHYTSADYARAAHAGYPLPHTLVGYLGYPARKRAANLSPAVREEKMRIFLAYAKHDPHVCATRAACRANTLYSARMARLWVAATIP